MKETANKKVVIRENDIDCEFRNLSDMDSISDQQKPQLVTNMKSRSKWIPNVKNKSIILSQKVELPKNSQTSFTKGMKSNSTKINRRISLTANSFFSKCLSSNSFGNKDTQEKQANSPKQNTSVHKPHEKATPVFNLCSTSAVSTPASDHHSNSSISSLSEKSAIGKSINAIKKTFTLFSDINSTEHPSDSSDIEIDFDETLTDDMHSMRRTLSFTDSDRRQVISFVLGETDYIPGYTMNVNSAESPNSFSISNQGVRQRSKTIDNTDKENENETSGVLGSIANLVKTTNSTSPLPLRTSTNQSSEPTFSLKMIQNLEHLNPDEILERLLESYSIVYLCEALSINDNDVLQSTLSTYLNNFYDFTNEPLDFSMRKFLMVNYLPKETQQIDRVIYAFAKRYYECNPHLGFDLDSVYILTYSITMVHTDRFNPNNKKKMSRYEFVENVNNAIQLDIDKFNSNKTLFLKELLGYFYDNITFCPLIKISPEQGESVLHCLIDNQVLPYPQIKFAGGMLNNNDVSRPLSNTSTSSSTIPRSTSQSSHTSIRKKSSSFLWSNSNTCDPYEFILKNSIKELDPLRLLYGKDDISISYDNPFLSTNNELQLKSTTPSMKMIDTELSYYRNNSAANIDRDLLNRFWKNMTSDTSEYIFKIEKKNASFLLNEKTETISLNDTVGNENYLIRVVKVGILYIQETVSNSGQTNVLNSVPVPAPKATDLLTTDPEILNNKKNLKWKPYFAILTPLGLFLFDDVSYFRMRSNKSTLKKVRNTVIIEPTSPKTGVYKEFKNKSLLETRSTSLESSGFTPFSYFKSEKSESNKSLNPCLCLDSDLYATRKFQNLDYDKIVNQPFWSRVSKMDISAEFDIKSLYEPRSKTRKDNSKVSSAVSGKNELNYTFFIYDKKSKHLCMVASEKELSDWIHSINAVNAFKSIDAEYKPLDFTEVVEKNNINVNHSKYYEVILKRKNILQSRSKSPAAEDKSPRKRSNTECFQSSKTSDLCNPSNSYLRISPTEKIVTNDDKDSMVSDLLNYNNCQKILDDSGPEELQSTYPHNDLLQHLYAVQSLKITMPVQEKTKEELLYTLKIIAVKLEWIWYEKCKLQMIALINDQFAQLVNVIDGNNI